MIFMEVGLVFMDKDPGESDSYYYKKMELMEKELKKNKNIYSLSNNEMEKIVSDVNKQVAKELYGCVY